LAHLKADRQKAIPDKEANKGQKREPKAEIGKQKPKKS